MSSQYKVCPLFWDGCGNSRSLSNAKLLEELLNDAWDYAGEIPGFQEEYIRQVKVMLETARKVVTE